MQATMYLARYQVKPGNAHILAAFRVVRYLKTTQEYKLRFGAANFPYRQVLIGFADSDFASCETAKSTTGFCFYVHGSLVYASSKRQTCVTTNTAEAELVAACAAAKMGTYLMRLLNDDFDEKLTKFDLMEDKSACISIARGSSGFQRTRHIKVNSCWLRQCVKVLGTCNLIKIDTHENIADALTKSLCKQKFVFYRGLLLCDGAITNFNDFVAVIASRGRKKKLSSKIHDSNSWRTLRDDTKAANEQNVGSQDQGL
jgi:hypothetical protein